MSDAIVTDLLRGDDDARLAPTTFSLFIRGPVSGLTSRPPTRSLVGVTAGCMQDLCPSSGVDRGARIAARWLS